MEKNKNEKREYGNNSTKTKYVISENAMFRNPYNFIPTDFNTKSQADTDEEKIAGMLECSLYTKSPIAILDTITSVKDDEGHTRHYFMKDEQGNYLIPGSSLRGTIRSVHEAVTDSCFSTIKEDEYITSRVTKSFKNVGILKRENDEWKLYEATRYMLLAGEKNICKGSTEKNSTKKDSTKKDSTEKKSIEINVRVWECSQYMVCYDDNGKYINDDISKIYSGNMLYMLPLKDENGKRIRYRKKIGKDGKEISCGWVAEKVSSKQHKGWLKGYLVLGEEFSSKKHHESVFCINQENGNDKIIAIDKDVMKSAIKGLEETYRVYNDVAINRNLAKKPEVGWYSSFIRMKEDGCIPVWYDYQEANNILYLSFAAIGRRAYLNSYWDLVRKKKPCRTKQNMCATCSVFGMVSKEDALASRVRFTDATCNTDTAVKVMTLTELSSPKPSYLPFYLRKRNVKSKEDKQEFGYDNRQYELRGRKFYWHDKTIKTTEEKTVRNATVETLQLLENEKFSFKVYFDGITKKELKYLVYSLNFGENEIDGKLCHKIGHGKPIGLGSVKIVVDNIQQRNFSLENGYTNEVNVYDDVKCSIELSAEEKSEQKAISYLEKIVSIEQKNNIETCYPYILIPQNTIYNSLSQNETAAHHWFSENYSMKNTKNLEEKMLPEITEGRVLYAYELVKGR